MNGLLILQAVTTAVQQPVHPNGILGLDNTSIFLASLVSLLAAVGVVVAIWRSITSNAKENKKEQIEEANRRSREITDKLDGMNTTLVQRITTVEIAVQDFMPKQQIMEKFVHEKGSREQANLAAMAAITKHDELITNLRLAQERQRTDHENLAGDVQEIKELIREKLDETKALIKEKIQDLKEHVQEQSEDLNKRIDDLVKTEADHFNQTCTSIRESTKRTVNPGNG